MNPAIAITGHVRQAAIAYAQQHGTVTAAALERALGDDIGTSNVATMTLCRLAKDGLLRRVGHGVYALGPTAATLLGLSAPIVVAATLDKLTQDYPDALDAELRRRGWIR